MEKRYLSKVRSVGSSLGVIVPAQFLRALDFRRGDEVIFGIADNETLFFRKPRPEDYQTFSH